MPGGRPTKYKKEYCKKLIEYAETGCSYEAFAGNIGVSKDTLYEWEKVHPEFSDAKKIYKARSLEWWEQKGIEGMFENIEYDESGKPLSRKKLNSSVWIFNMKNRAGWKDKVEAEVHAEGAIKLAYDPKDK